MSMGDIAKVIPLMFKGLIFLVVTVPTTIVSIIKTIGQFTKKAVPIAFAVVLSFFLIFFGIQFLITYLTGAQGLIPHIPLAMLTMVLVFDLVMNNTAQLKIFQKYVLKGFLFLFNNPLLKDIFGFDVKVDSKNPDKAFEQILKWTMKNLVKIVFTFFGLAIMLKLLILNSWKYITFYSQ
jgi:hypothetical protein